MAQRKHSRSGTKLSPTSFMGSEGAARLLAKLLHRKKGMSHDSIRQFVLRKKLIAYYYDKAGVLRIYDPDQDTEGKIPFFLFLIDDIYALAEEIIPHIGREGYPDEIKEKALSLYRQNRTRRERGEKPYSNRDIARIIQVSPQTINTWIRKYDREQLVQEAQ